MSDLEVRHCRVLVAVNDNGGVAAAARALGLAQSTVSETLLSLERVLGAAVTQRRPGKEAALTAEAEALLPYAQALIAASEAALAAFANRGEAALRLGAVESISSFLLPGPLRSFRSRWPQAEVSIAVGLCEDLRRRVGRGELDAAITIEGGDPLAEAGSVTRVLAPAQLRLVVSPANPLARAPIARSDLTGRTLLLADPDGAFNGLMRAWAAGIAPPPRFESAGSIDGVKRGVLSSDAVGVLPDYAVAEELASQALAALTVREPIPAIALRLTTRETPAGSSRLGGLVALIGEELNAPQAFG